MTKQQANRNDVARAAGVSVATVSYVINNGPRPVAPATRARVLAAIDEVGYTPNLIARSLAGGASNTYGFVAPNITNPFIAEIAHALQAHAHSTGRLVLVGDSADSAERERDLLASMVARRVDGIIYMGVTEKLATDLLGDARIPTVVVTHSDSDGFCPSVRIDEAAATAALSNHLLDHGYRSLALLTGPRSMMNSHLRMEGMMRPLREKGIEPVSVGWEAYSRAAGYAWASALIHEAIGGVNTDRGACAALSSGTNGAGEAQTSPRVRPRADGGIDGMPRGIVTGNERQAAGILAALTDAGIRVPDQVAVVALNGSAAGAYLTPSLTCIRQPMGEIARRVFEIFDSYDQRDARGNLCDFDLVIGGSCGCREAHPRSTLAAWNTPEPHTLDSAAGVERLA